MVKLRSMVVGADKAGVDSTSADDRRITWIGKLVRKYKLDEVSQLWNVLVGHMSLVGPRPNVKRETDIYTEKEKKLLDVRPGVTDLASIVFADENDILEGSEDPDLKYNQVIRPWKSRLGLLYVQKASLILDIKIIFLTALAMVMRGAALGKVSKLLAALGAEPMLMEVSRRDKPLEPFPPPGATEVVQDRNAPPT
jgi:lipopolysaccharide/colanic/teichoic acid biosynthesis glycosyltransferase